MEGRKRKDCERGKDVIIKMKIRTCPRHSMLWIVLWTQNNIVSTEQQHEEAALREGKSVSKCGDP